MNTTARVILIHDVDKTQNHAVMILAQKAGHRFSLVFQYTATIITLIVIGMGSLASVMVYHQIQQNERYTNGFGQIIAKQLAAAAVEPLFTDQPFELQVLINNFATDENILSAAIYTVDKVKVAHKGNVFLTSKLRLDQPFYKLVAKDRTYQSFFKQNVVHTSPIQFKGVKAGYAVIVFSQDILNEQFKKSMYLMLITFAISFVLVILAGLLIGRKLSSPIRNLVHAANKIRDGKIDQITDRRNDEIGTLIDAINTMSQGLIRKNQVEDMLDKFLTKDVAEKVMGELDPVQMAGEHVYATVLFADIVGFTSISEKIDPQDVQKLLNEYYGYFNSCARINFGTVDKFIGDCVMIVFGATKEDPKHQYNAITCAILMQQLAKHLNIRREKQGLYPIEFRIGINSGKMMAGLLGSSERMEYTVVGDAVNLASRLCSEAEGVQIIIEESLFESVDPEYALEVDKHSEIKVRGKEEPVKIYSVIDIEHSHQVAMDDLFSEILSQKG